MTFSATVWKTLSAIDVSKHVEKKMNLSYLSWAWAWGTLMEHYPDSYYSFREPVSYPDQSVEVWVDLTISDGKDAMTRTMWLPVMNHKNQAIQNPDSRSISDTRMRCLVKALAMCGLGHYIYAGEDLPESVKVDEKLHKAVNYFREKIDADITEEEREESIKKAWNRLNHDEQMEVFNALKEFKHGRKQYNNILRGYLEMTEAA